MGVRRRENKGSLKIGGNNSIIKQVEAFLQATYPASWMPKIIARELSLTSDKGYEAVKKACQNLLKQGKCSRPPGISRQWYTGIPTILNISRLEEPEQEMHCIKLKVEVNPKIIEHWEREKMGDRPPCLYSQRERITIGTKQRKANDKSDDVWYEQISYWHSQGNIYKVTFQLFEKCVAIHINASKYPIKEIQVWPLKSWIIGILEGLGVDTNIILSTLVYAEISKDYRKITITPKMLLLEDLETQSFLRIYRKTWNLTRLEIGTTYEGDKELWHMFKNFGKPAFDDSDDKSDLGAMYR